MYLMTFVGGRPVATFNPTEDQRELWDYGNGQHFTEIVNYAFKVDEPDWLECWAIAYGL